MTDQPLRTPQAGPPRDVHLAYGFATDRGLRRELNEDSLIAAEPVFAVADGMGGHAAGEVASGICVRTLGSSPILGHHLPEFSAADLEELIDDADQEIRRQAGGLAGTTLSGVVLVQEEGVPCWLFFNVGDSRTYRLSRDRFGQISVDHSEVQELVDTGSISMEESRTHPRRHVVTRALGTGDDSEADFWLMPVEDGDRILVCSDGLSGEVSDDAIYDVLSTVADPQQACEELVEATLRSGARDNVTLIIVDAHVDTRVDDAAAADVEGSAVRRGGILAADVGHLIPAGTTADTQPDDVVRMNDTQPDDVVRVNGSHAVLRSDAAPGSPHQ
ncbi:PP2C family protein-serine/threonine phosphatase [Arthrobacter sp. MDT3-44]